ncbi:vitelline membrane outer layer protein 1-like [Dreissena polymorpha]|uniref:Uncharacterized protein n=1 Tax=Dreissena polymorpha TaxID=45954 RepID=A0A9D3YFM2_DREPO|nr:vitelline membrane outer layer protein 1-like [Dreissena polymorpha]KAH3697635.1 hypothetical protein DPMN_085140 [Dreissena polymorpha]
MATFSLIVMLGLFSCTVVCGYLLPGEFRKVVATLHASNGGGFGSWAEPQYCARSTYAVGYKIKVEQSQGNHDDTALNGISLVCAHLDGTFGGDITSGVGNFGSWYNPVYCPHDDIEYVQIMVQFNFRVEPSQGHNDDTAANDVQFKCNDLEGRDPARDVVIHAPGRTGWGSWAWSTTCPENSGICGIQTRVEPPIGNGDDTGLNDVNLFCCKD